MLDPDGFDALVGRLYDAALDERDWPAALHALALSFGGIGFSLLDLGAPDPLLAVSEALEAPAALYAAGWWRKDPMLALGQRQPITGVVCDSDFFDTAFKARDPFYQDFCRAYGSESILSVLTKPYAGTTLAVNIQRRIGAGPVDPAERALFTAIGRHVSRAAAVAARLNASEGIGRELLSRLSAFDCAVALVDRTGRVLMANDAFSALAAEGLQIRRGRIVAAAPSAQAALDRMIAEVLDPALPRRTPDTLALPRPESLLPLLLRATPLKPETAERQIGSIPARAAMITVLNPDHPAYPSASRTLTALGLTPGQARVALLVGGGRSVAEAAEDLGIAVETVRTNLKHVYARLGVNRQADLARLVARSVSFDRQPDG